MYQPTRTYPFCVIVSRSPEQNIINTSSGRRSSDSLFSLDVGVVVATNVVRGDGPRHGQSALRSPKQIRTSAATRRDCRASVFADVIRINERRRRLMRRKLGTSFTNNNDNTFDRPSGVSYNHC